MVLQELMFPYSLSDHLRMESNLERVGGFIRKMSDLRIDPMLIYEEGLMTIAYLMDRADVGEIRESLNSRLDLSEEVGEQIKLEIQSMSAYSALMDIFGSPEAKDRFNRGYNGPHPQPRTPGKRWGTISGLRSSLEDLHGGLVNPELLRRVTYHDESVYFYGHLKKALKEGGFVEKSPVYLLAFLFRLEAESRRRMLIQLDLPLETYSNNFPVNYSYHSPELGGRREAKARVLRGILLGTRRDGVKSKRLGGVDNLGTEYMRGYLAAVRKNINSLLVQNYTGDEREVVARILGRLALMRLNNYRDRYGFKGELLQVLTALGARSLGLAFDEIERLSRENLGMVPHYEFTGF